MYLMFQGAVSHLEVEVLAAVVEVSEEAVGVVDGAGLTLFRTAR